MNRAQNCKRIGHLMKTVQHDLRQTMDNALQSLGISSAQYFAMRKLVNYSGISNAELARKCLVTPQTMIVMIAGLETSGLLERANHKTKGRIQKIALTKSGEALLTEADALILGVEGSFFENLSAGDLERLSDLLGKLCQRS